MPVPKRRLLRTRGITMVEVLVVIAIVAILASLAAPSFTGLINASKRQTAVDALLKSLNLARSEAVKRNATVVVCKSSDGASCAKKGHWSQGWMVFVSDDATYTAGETIVAIRQALGGSTILSGEAAVADFVRFDGLGRAKYATGVTVSNAAITACTPSESPFKVQRIVLNAAGRAKVESATETTCPPTPPTKK